MPPVVDEPDALEPDEPEADEPEEADALLLFATAKLRAKVDDAAALAGVVAAAGASLVLGDGAAAAAAGAAVGEAAGLGVDVLAAPIRGGSSEGEPSEPAWPMATLQSTTVTTPTAEKARTIPVECGSLRRARQLLEEKLA